MLDSALARAPTLVRSELEGDLDGRHGGTPDYFVARTAGQAQASTASEDTKTSRQER